MVHTTSIAVMRCAIIALVCPTAGCVAPAAPAPVMGTDLVLETPAWFVGAVSGGLGATPNGALVVTRDGSTLGVEPAATPLFGAAFYPASDVLVTVGVDATVRLMERRGKNWSLVAEQPTDYVAATRSVRFSRVPGLVYVLSTDVAHDEALRTPDMQRQEYSDRYHRVTLSDTARAWHAIPGSQAREDVLAWSYRTGADALSLIGPDDKAIQLSLPGRLTDPFRSGPRDDLAQSVFLFQGQAIVCLTEQGWSLHEPDGRPVQRFALDGIPGGWWSDPFFKDGELYVVRRVGPGGHSYHMDRATGRLIEMRPAVLPDR